MVAVHTEVERKYDVDPDAVLPELPGADAPVRDQLVATYLDTADLRLLTARVTLRRRTGGQDEGWHLKLPDADESRTEVHEPLGDPGDVPPALLDLVRVHVRGAEVAPVATLTTHRTVHRLRREPGGPVLAEVCDDRVRAESDGVVREWREWEVELVTGGPEVFDAVDPLLRRAGAVDAGRASKVQRALGERLPGPRPEIGGSATVGELLTAYLADQLDRLHHQDRLFRTGEVDEPVHQLRVAARRLRSVLATYRPVLDPDRVEPLRDRLRQAGQALSPARDLAVLRDRVDLLLEGMLEAGEDEPALTVTRGYVDRELGRRLDAAVDGANAALAAPGWFRLVEDVERLVALPPYREDGHGEAPAGDVVPRLLRRDRRRLRKRHRRAMAHPPGAERALGLHEVRKATKRLRYAAESAAPSLGGKAAALAADAEAVQDLLGEHQDTVVSRQVLRELAADAPVGEVGLVLGRLLEREERRADELAGEYGDLVAPLVRKKPPGWLR